jgi:hypothetical protein
MARAARRRSFGLAGRQVWSVEALRATTSGNAAADGGGRCGVDEAAAGLLGYPSARAALAAGGEDGLVCAGVRSRALEATTRGAVGFVGECLRKSGQRMPCRFVTSREPGTGELLLLFSPTGREDAQEVEGWRRWWRRAPQRSRRVRRVILGRVPTGLRQGHGAPWVCSTRCSAHDGPPRRVAAAWQERLRYFPGPRRSSLGEGRGVSTPRTNEKRGLLHRRRGSQHVILTRKSLHRDPQAAADAGRHHRLTERKQMEELLRRSGDERDRGSPSEPPSWRRHPPARPEMEGSGRARSASGSSPSGCRRSSGRRGPTAASTTSTPAGPT